MEYALWEILLSLLAALGLFALGQWSLRWILTPDPGDLEGYTVLPVRGDAQGLEQAVKALRFAGQGPIVIADAGLTGEGKAVARILARDRLVSLCPISRVGEYLST